ncbi:MAG: CRTAC1 family protein [Thermoanaerobaculia bacterium]|nr:CRTAC1 family protein [Thermoanaerobaculia bacterium]
MSWSDRLGKLVPVGLLCLSVGWTSCQRGSGSGPADADLPEDLTTETRAATGTTADDSAQSTPGGWFESVPAGLSGLDFTYRSGAGGEFLYPESMGGGVGLCDVDQDGDLDVVLLQGGPIARDRSAPGGPRLFLNRGDGSFVDTTTGAGLKNTGYAMGVACGDVDNDGDVDLYITQLGANVLLLNDGAARFLDVTAGAGVGDLSWSASATFLDYDGDGWLDLYVTNYLHWTHDIERPCFDADGVRDYCGPTQYRAPARDTLYRNLGNGRFEDVSVVAGLGAAIGNGLGVVASDFDRDGRIDVYVANDQSANQLWLQRADGTFVDQALQAGVALNGIGQAEAGMGVSVADIDDDGWPDLFLTHLSGESNTFYTNREGLFDDDSSRRRLAAPSLHATGFGNGFFDFDLDGRLDLFVANGRVKRELPIYDADDPFAEPDLLFRGLADGDFAVGEIGVAAAEALRTSRAAAFGDLDGDGDIDALIVNRDRPVTLLRNVASRGHFLELRLMDVRGRDALGARVTVIAEGREQTRWVQPGSGYLTSNPASVTFGLGVADRVDRVEVHWPQGGVTRIGPLGVDRRVVLVEPATPH